MCVSNSFSDVCVEMSRVKTDASTATLGREGQMSKVPWTSRDDLAVAERMVERVMC
jgi:hypothetical protein